MKQFKVLAFIMLFAFTVGYASDSSPGYEKSTLPKVLLAQVEAPAVQQPMDEDTSQSTIIGKVEEVVSAVGIPIDTVNSIDEIVDKGTYYVKNIPKTNSPKDWIAWLFGIIGLLFGAVIYFKNKFRRTQ